ncbi:hypothetical protein BC792_1279 [Sphingobacterium allocomposti]|uniref:Uncharacterized protein n=1 Tax=Sphingobacterium allocomposti TaxID=415956 RepID=A0A5S5D2C3_9SPHI|nr:hypothetical protein [Sphingobacterium composti Yoo et al. 2007 non Ten et al. 2007]TYP89408.1 hypothetical protein BC792_1279 [Sphingobacterium composti Yoo et al. 2007 non Ten et al. 2007]
MDTQKLNVLVFDGVVKFASEPDYYMQGQDEYIIELTIDNQMLDDHEFLSSYIRDKASSFLTKEKVKPQDYYMEVVFVQHHAELLKEEKTLIRVITKKK